MRSALALIARHLEQLIGVLEPVADAIKRQDDVFQRLLFLREFLRTLGLVPDFRVFELAVDGV